MNKITKLLIKADLLVLLIAVIFGLWTRGSDDNSGIILFYPLIAMVVITVAVIVFSFLGAVRRTVSTERTSAMQFIWTALLLVGVPSLGLYYATHGQNRDKLVVISTIGLLVGLTGLFVLSVKRIRS